MNAEHHRLHLRRLAGMGDWTGVERLARRHGWSLAGKALARALGRLWHRLLLLVLRRQPLA